jgi:peptide/nickel transport system substrate-binding protein
MPEVWMIGRGQQKVRWGLLAWIAAIGGLILPTSCAPERNQGVADRGVLVITEAEQTSTFVRNFNPFFEWGDVRWPTRRAMYEPLLIFNILSDKYTPWLATGYEWSESNKKLTIHIREGVKWSDGKSFSAGDVVFTFKLMKRFAALDTRGVWKYI